MSMSFSRRVRVTLLVLALSFVVVSAVGAQTLGTFQWQTKPFCNVLTLTVTQVGGSYRLDGFDDRCGASIRASAIGVAFPNPDGTIGIGLTIGDVPSGRSIHIDATISLATLSGKWRDGNAVTGPFTFGAGTGSEPRPGPYGLITESFQEAALLAGIGGRGSLEAPLPPTANHVLAMIGGGGFTPGGSSFLAGFMDARASEDWTATAHGGELNFFTTPNGTMSPVQRMTLTHDGKVGIGNHAPADRLQVAGDIRVGTPLLGGCVRSYAGVQIAGTCFSDARFKRDITPFAPALDAVAKLRPVHYYWRSAEFPEKAFGPGPAYGLIAQDVATVLPDLVSTDDDGYQAVDYAKLPLLAIQAIKELKNDNDALKAQNDALERRLAAIEARLPNR